MAAALAFGPAHRSRVRRLHALLVVPATAPALLAHHSISADSSPTIRAMPGMAHSTAGPAGASA
ncbi:hypothetical protein TR51_11105 [Kitasatospora griseola]|uniref:Uncharacterized protein n=1 Tax=Kitasatospora griseola TaxID=2064 RepID=A0A0D0PQD9_KITGR|nr:hypothetical protein TR51_11105 [Kitasatospora griseola]